jgi:hypothetical protein
LASLTSSWSAPQMSLARVQTLLAQLNVPPKDAVRDGDGGGDDEDEDEEGEEGGDGDEEDDEEGDPAEEEKQGKDGDEENGKTEGRDSDDDSDDGDSDNDDDDDDDEPKTIAAFFENPKHHYDRAFIQHDSFHTLYVSKDNATVLLRVRRARMRRLFYVQMTHESSEGSFPSMFDITPKNVGLCFLPEPALGGSESNRVLLVEAQQSMPETDLIASLYDPDFNGLKSGHIREFTPLVDDKETGEVLIDVTFWLQSFGMYANSAGGFMHEHAAREQEVEAETDGGMYLRHRQHAACCGYHLGTHTKLFGHNNHLGEGLAVGATIIGAGHAGFSGAVPPLHASPWLGWNGWNGWDGGDQEVQEAVVGVHPVGEGQFPPVPGMSMGGMPGVGGSRLMEVLSYPENFVLKFKSQLGMYPLKVSPHTAWGPARPMPLVTS